MEETPRLGTSIKNLELLELEATTDHSIFVELESNQTCKSGTLTVVGGKSSNLTVNTSGMYGTKRYSMLLEVKMLKPKMSKSTRDIRVLTRNGRSSTLTKLRKLPQKDSIKISVSRLTSHSTSSQECQ